MKQEDMKLKSSRKRKEKKFLSPSLLAHGDKKRLKPKFISSESEDEVKNEQEDLNPSDTSSKSVLNLDEEVGMMYFYYVFWSFIYDPIVVFDHKNPHWNDPIFPWIFIFTTSPTVLLTKFSLEIVKKNSVVSLKDIECTLHVDVDCLLTLFLFRKKRSLLEKFLVAIYQNSKEWRMFGSNYMEKSTWCLYWMKIQLFLCFFFFIVSILWIKHKRCWGRNHL